MSDLFGWIFLLTTAPISTCGGNGGASDGGNDSGSISGGADGNGSAGGSAGSVLGRIGDVSGRLYLALQA